MSDNAINKNILRQSLLKNCFGERSTFAASFADASEVKKASVDKEEKEQE
jgi:hypothetical protein